MGEPLASLTYWLSAMWEYGTSEVFWGVHIMILVGIIHLIITKRRKR
jgi:hypothetical protein